MSLASLVKIGTRKSQLALVQANWVKLRLEQLGLSCEIVTFSSEGDENVKKPLFEMAKGSPGLFTKFLEAALLENKIDIAVHSLKDLATEIPSGLLLGAVTARETTKDCILTHAAAYEPSAPLGLKKGSRVGTSSPRREAQLLSIDSSLIIESIRGNVPTRVERVKQGKIDAVCLAGAGLERLGLDLNPLIKVELGFPTCPGQGALGIEMRADASVSLLQKVKQLNDEKSARETHLERRLLNILEGGCTLPFAATAIWNSTSRHYSLSAFLGLRKDNQWAGSSAFDISGVAEEICFSKATSHFKSSMA